MQQRTPVALAGAALSTLVLPGIAVALPTDDAANFHCGGNLETTAVVCDELRTRYKNETGGSLDTNGIGVTGQGACHAAH